MKKNTEQQTIAEVQQTIAEVKADIIRTEKHTWYCELIIAACLGASLTLIGVIAHMMITGPAWTW